MATKKTTTKKVVTKKSLPKAQDGKQVKGMYDFKNVHTGPDSTNPGVIKAQADKKKRDAVVSAYKKTTKTKKK